jgi:predicted nucleotidyltransferase
MQNQPVTKKLLQVMTEKIVREINPRNVVLFGSHARGTARPDSDLDFLIIEDDPFSGQRSRCAEIIENTSSSKKRHWKKEDKEVTGLTRYIEQTNQRE